MQRRVEIVSLDGEGAGDGGRRVVDARWPAFVLVMAEIAEHAVAHDLVDLAAEFNDGVRNRRENMLKVREALVRVRHLGDARVAYDVDEHHC